MKISSIALTSLIFASAASAFVPASVSSCNSKSALFGTRKNLADAWTNAVQRGQNPARVTVEAAKFSVNQSVHNLRRHEDVTEDSIAAAAAEFEALGGGDVMYDPDDAKYFLEDAVADAEVEFYKDMAEASQEVEKGAFIAAIAKAQDKFHRAVSSAKDSAPETVATESETPPSFFEDAEIFEEGDVMFTNTRTRTGPKLVNPIQDKITEIMEDPVVKGNVEKVSKFVEDSHIKEEAPKVAEKVGGVLAGTADLLMKKGVMPMLGELGKSLKEAKAQRELQALGKDMKKDGNPLGLQAKGKDGKTLAEHMEAAEEEEQFLNDHMDHVAQILAEAEKSINSIPTYVPPVAEVETPVQPEPTYNPINANPPVAKATQPTPAKDPIQAQPATETAKPIQSQQTYNPIQAPPVKESSPTQTEKPKNPYEAYYDQKMPPKVEKAIQAQKMLAKVEKPIQTEHTFNPPVTEAATPIQSQHTSNPVQAQPVKDQLASEIPKANPYEAYYEQQRQAEAKQSMFAKPEFPPTPPKHEPPHQSPFDSHYD